MLGAVWNTILVNPIFNVLIAFYKVTGSLGISIVMLTVVIRAILLPVVIPSLNNIKKQQDLQPELDKLKKKFKYDKKKLAEKQMELFKQHGLNPASGCLSQVAMIIVLIALFSVIRKFSTGADVGELNRLLYFNSLKFNGVSSIDTKFLYLDLAKPDPYYLLAVLSGVFQLVASKMSIPFTEAGEKAAKRTPDKKDDITYNVQNQMLYTMPVMNFIIGVTLPAGVVLYIVTTTLFSIAQNYYVNGLGGLKPWIRKIKNG